MIQYELECIVVSEGVIPVLGAEGICPLLVHVVDVLCVLDRELIY